MSKTLRGVENGLQGLAMRVKHFRWDRGWNQERMSEYVGVSVRTLRRLEAGEEIGEESVYRLNKVLAQNGKN